MSRVFKVKNPSKFAFMATGSAITVTIGSFLLEFVPHSLLLEKTKKVLQMHRLGEPMELDKNIHTMFQNVLNDLKIEEPMQKHFEPFAVTGFNLYHAGFAGSRFGAKIGIPINFSYKTTSDVDYVDMRLGYDREALNIHHPSSNDLIDSIVLSDKAKKFGIAREILMAQEEIPLYKCIETPVIILTTFFATELARVKLKFAEKPAPIGILSYVTICIMGFATWFQIRDGITTYFEKEVDKKLAQMGPEYLEGGKEFYEKSIKRNKALRTLLGPPGVKSFNRDGDEIFFIRNKRTPLTHRKKFFSEFTLESQEQAV